MKYFITLIFINFLSLFAFTQSNPTIFHNIVVPEKKIELSIMAEFGPSIPSNTTQHSFLSAFYSVTGNIGLFKGKKVANISYDSANIPDPKTTSLDDLSVYFKKSYGHTLSIDFGIDKILAITGYSNYTYITLIPKYSYTLDKISGFIGTGLSFKLSGNRQVINSNTSDRYTFGSNNYINILYGVGCDIKKSISVGVKVRLMVPAKIEEKYQNYYEAGGGVSLYFRFKII
jgi:hypothetical protein